MTRAGGVLENRGIFTAVLGLVNGAGLTEGGSSVEARPVPCGPRAIPTRADANFLEFASGGRARVRLRTGGLPVVPTCAATRSASSPAREQAKGHKRRIKTATARDERERQHPDREERQARAGALPSTGREGGAPVPLLRSTRSPNTARRCSNLFPGEREAASRAVVSSMARVQKHASFVSITGGEGARCVQSICDART